MIRKMFFTGLVATGLLGGMTMTATAAPGFPQVGHDHDHDHDHHARYQVLIRHGHHWDVYRTFRDRDDAHRAARHLERHGHDARVQRVGGW